MNLKEKLADAHNNFPIIESHPAMLYAEALNEIIELEEALEECRKYFQSRRRRFEMEWIDKNSALPQNDEWVIGTDCEHVFECFHFDDGCFIDKHGRPVLVFFWMDKPEPPKLPDDWEPLKDEESFFKNGSV
jgi:hypothetical protein